MNKLLDLLERYVGGELDSGSLHKKLYTQSKRMDWDLVDPLVAGLLEDLQADIDDLVRQMSHHDAHDDGSLRLQVAASLAEIRATLDA